MEAALRPGERQFHPTQQGWLSDKNQERLANSLGWFSIGLGLAEVVAPRQLARLLGIEERNALLRSLGVREILSGVGILTQQRPAGWLWARVAGDATDLALLGMAFLSPQTKRDRVTAATAAVAGVTILDVFSAQQLSQTDGAVARRGVIHARKSVTINASPEELYRFWHDFENLPRFMKHLESVKVTGEKHSHWVVKAPAGTTVEWDAEITEDRPNELIAWRSLEGASLDNRGSVRFQPAAGGRGTMVRVEIEYRPLAGKLGSFVAKLFSREPQQEIQEDLRRFKQVIETGEIITTEGQPAGRASSTSWKYDQTVRS
jgi:uncharacterized membrane protein